MLKSKIATLVLFVIFVVGIVISMLSHIDSSSQKYKMLLEQALVQEAVAHFDSMVMTRSWNAGHGGVFVKQQNGIKPNPYLKNNFIKSDLNETLIKVNPAWMTRQISEISNKDSDYYYKITSLKPINPGNKPDIFEKEALEFLEKNRDKKYYYKINEIKNSVTKFDFLGRLMVTPKCMQCHSFQGYKVDDIRGGIRVTIPTQNYSELLEHNKSELKLLYKLIIFIAMVIVLLVSWLMYKDYQYQEKLKEEKKTFQNLIDLQNGIVIITDGEKLHYGNKGFFDFFNYTDLQAFLQDYDCICDRFESDDDYFHMGKIDKDTNWVYYLYEANSTERFVNIANAEGSKHSFSVHLNKLDDELFIVVFSDISNRMREYLKLEKKVLLENMMIAQSRVNAMSDMIKMVSHQWRQPLATLSMINAGMMTDVELDEFNKESLMDSSGLLEKELQKLSDIIDNFDNIYTPTSSLESDVNLMQLIEYTMSLKAVEFEKNHILAKVDFCEKVLLNTHSKDLTKIILDILNNAQEAILKNNVESGIIKLNVKTNESFVIIKIEDNGKGIKEDILTSIFEPYFTTKDIHNEAGLSLFMAKMTLERFLNGSISVENGKYGAIFTISIKMQ